MKHFLASLSLFLIVTCIVLVLSTKEGICQDVMSEFEPLITDVTSYFIPVSGRLQKGDHNQILIEKGSSDGIKQGMRISIYREDEGFIHPVTRERLGKVEKLIGTGEVIETRQKDSTIRIISGDRDALQDTKFKIRQSKINALFLQTDINWYLGDSYYHALKSNGRFHLIDSRLDTFDLSKLSAEAKDQSAEIVIVIDSERDADKTYLRQRVYWASDMVQLTEKKATISSASIQSILNKQARFVSADSNILLNYQVSRQIQKIALADLDGDGIEEMILATKDNLAVYQLGTDLKLIWDFKTALSDDILWIDVFRKNVDKRDSIVLTMMKGTDVKSVVYTMVDYKLVVESEIDSVFLRVIDNKILGQDFSRVEGFENNVFEYTIRDGRLIKGEPITLPKDVNIYDFSPIESPDGKKALLTVNDNGIVSIYSNRGIVLWRSPEDFGGSIKTYKKLSNIAMIDRGHWSIRDRLIPKAGGVLIPKRNPIFEFTKGLGNKSTDIILLWYNGITVEQNKIVENIAGDLLDYNLHKDRLIVLLKPPFGIKTSNLLKGANPFVNTIQIISIKGFYN
ncbi:MAG: hypothetical protein SNJ53_08540 [Thermodesulfovibrionales bacterium]